MPHQEAELHAAKGREALRNGHAYLAMICFEQALRLERAPLTCSSLAYCLALVRKNYQEAIPLAQEALEREPENPRHYWNLGRIQLLAGNKEQGIIVLRQGLHYGKDKDIIRELEKLEVRNPLIFNKLPRRHPLNKYSGLMLAKLGLR